MQLRATELDIVAGSFLFTGVEADRLTALLADGRCARRTAEKGEAIFTPERFEPGIALVLHGSVLVTKGRLVMSVLGPGDAFGAATLFNDAPEYATTLTARGAVAYLFLDGALVSELLCRDERVMLNYVSYLSRRIRFLSARIDALGAGSGAEKLYAWLLDRADDRGALVLDLSMTKLAESLSLGRASLYRAMDELEARGNLRRDGKRIQLLHQ